MRVLLQIQPSSMIFDSRISANILLEHRNHDNTCWRNWWSSYQSENQNLETAKAELERGFPWLLWKMGRKHDRINSNIFANELGWSPASMDGNYLLDSLYDRYFLHYWWIFRFGDRALLVLTRQSGVIENRIVFHILDKITSLFPLFLSLSCWLY